MNLEIDGEERDILIRGLALLLSDQGNQAPRTCIELLKRIGALTPEPEVPYMDVSSPGYTCCQSCRPNEYVPDADFKHRPGCAWVRRYGGLTL